MEALKTAKIFFCLAVTLLVAKPFLGFTAFGGSHPPRAENIFVKAFTKRKQEYTEDSSFDVIAIQKKLANPFKQLFLRFSYFLNILFPRLLNDGQIINSRFLRSLKTNLSSPVHIFLLNSKLII